MEDESTDYLAHCPCCGGTAEIEEDEFGLMVRCTECGLNNGGEYAERFNGSAAEVIKKWNRRITIK